nr:alpha/beta fold hydrolase [Paenibacillus caui]
MEKLKEGRGSKQLVCFPYLGGYAGSFQGLAEELPDDVEVWAFNPPGHGRGGGEPLEHIEPMLQLYYEALLDVIKPGCLLFGHSLGGIVAYFTAERLLAGEHPHAATFRLVLSACNPPYECGETRYHELPDDRLIDQLISYGGLPEELVRERELLGYFLPVIHADFKVLYSSSTLNHAPLAVPAYYLWGERDRTVSLSSAIGWVRYFANEIQLIPIKDGSHMFVMYQPAVVADHLARLLAQTSR